MFQEALRWNPKYADALLEMANLRIVEKKLPEAEELLRRYVRVEPRSSHRLLQACDGGTKPA